MENIIFVLLCVSVWLFIVGLKKPQVSVFWAKESATVSRSKWVYGSSIVVFSLMFFVMAVEKDAKREIIPVYGLTEDVNNSSPSPAYENLQQSEPLKELEKSSTADQIIIDKIKAKVKRDYPQEYYLQKVMFDQEVDAFFYMKTVEDLEVKRKVQRDYPMEFYLQQVMYNQEIDAKVLMQ